MPESYRGDLSRLGISEISVRILRHTYDGVLITLKDGTIIFVNEAYSRIFGISPEGVLGQKLSEIEPGSIILKVLRSGQEAINVLEHVTTLNERIFGCVLLLPVSDDFLGSISIFRRYNEKLQNKGDHSSQRYLENYLEQISYSTKSLPDVFSNLIGQDEKFRQTLFKAYKASIADFPVLVLGESGTGKELIVRAIHKNSSRRNNKFVALNCAAITNTLVESELFGYESGSFTGARGKGKMGLFDLAHKGTLFFDEVCDFELPTQAKILRALQEKVIRRIGGEQDIPIDTRIMSATNKDMEDMVLKGNFREDLLYRINTMTIHIPPLRHRGNDLKMLVDYFVSQFSIQYQKEAEISDECMEIFYGYNWPGNVRELRNVLDYAVNMADGRLVTPHDLPSYLNIYGKKITLDRHLYHSEVGFPTNRGHPTYKKIMNLVEKELIEISIKRCKNRTEAMKLLGYSRRSFYIKLNKYSLL